MSILRREEESERDLRALAQVKMALENLREAQSVTHHHTALGFLGDAIKIVRYAEVTLLQEMER